MSDDILHTGRADIHHPKGPLTAQQPLSRDEQPAEVNWRAIAEGRDRELRAVGEARYKAERERDSLARRLNERYQQLEASRTALHQMTQEVARVRAAVAEEIARALENAATDARNHAEDAHTDPDLAAALPHEANAFMGAAEIAREHAAAPSVRPDTDRTPDVGTPDHSETQRLDPDRLRAAMAEELDALRAASLPEETPDAR